MRRNVITGFGAAVVTVALVACGGQGVDHEAIQRAAEEQGGQVRVAGCLQEGDEGRLVLMNAILARERSGFPLREGVAPPETMVGTSGSTASSPGRVRGPSYTIDAPEGVGDLRAHIGHQMQVTGRLAGVGEDSAAGTTVDYGADSDRAPAHRDGADEGTAGRIAADEIRLIAATCM